MDWVEINLTKPLALSQVNENGQICKCFFSGEVKMYMAIAIPFHGLFRNRVVIINCSAHAPYFLIRMV